MFQHLHDFRLLNRAVCWALFLHELKLISLYIARVALVPKCLLNLLNGASCLVTQTKWLLLVMYMCLCALRMHCPKLQMMQRRNRDRMICWVERKGSHHFCIIGVRLRFLYCLMCEPQPEAPQQRVVRVDVLYTTYLTRPVGGKAPSWHKPVQAGAPVQTHADVLW